MKRPASGPRFAFEDAPAAPQAPPAPISWDSETARLHCQCLRSDSWRCNTARREAGTAIGNIGCPCECHRYAFKQAAQTEAQTAVVPVWDAPEIPIRSWWRLGRLRVEIRGETSAMVWYTAPGDLEQRTMPREAFLAKAERSL